MGQPVVHWQMLAKNPDALTEFYSKLFSWKVDAENALGYRMLNTQSKEGIMGGIWPAPPEGKSMVSLYIGVPNINEYVEKAIQLGGKLIIPAQKLPDGDEMAVILDIEGMPVGLLKSASRPKTKSSKKRPTGKRKKK